MRLLFLFQRFSFKSSTIYLDLVRECVASGHEVYVLAGTSETEAFTEGAEEGEKYGIGSSRIVAREGCRVIYVRLPDQFHSGRIKKGLVQLMIEPIFLRALRDNIWEVKLDLIVYPTPPITLAGVVQKAKEHYGAVSYLMLKDIFPQNAADLDMMGKDSLIFKYFKRMERRLYEVSDRIGCMSDANVRYMYNHNPYIEDKLELFPNTVKLQPLTENKKKEPSDVVRFIVGGNLGEPQAVDLLMEGIGALAGEGFEKARFLIIGDGTRAAFVRKYIEEHSLDNVEYHSELPRDKYEELLARQDVGIISLSYRFTIPNFPSRLLSYMQIAKPVLVLSDNVTDIGDVVANRAQCGFSASSETVGDFVKAIKEVCSRKDELELMGRAGRKYLEKHFDVRLSVRLLERVGVAGA